jgi:hypothetical protein
LAQKKYIVPPYGRIEGEYGMKIWKLWTFVAVVIVIAFFGIMLTGCDLEPDEPTYTVWTGSASQLPSLNDGKYVRLELTNSEFNQMSLSLTDDYKHIWTEDQIYNWFIGRGFGNYEARQETAWLITINHGLIASRSGSIVYMLVK